VTPTLTSLVKKIDEAAVKNASDKLGSFAVILSDDDKLEASLKELAKKEELKKIMLGIDNPAGPDGYEIAKEAEVTIVLYKGKKVIKTFAFKKDELKDKNVTEVVDSLKEILPSK
jgi:hypothetical protein